MSMVHLSATRSMISRTSLSILGSVCGGGSARASLAFAAAISELRELRRGGDVFMLLPLSSELVLNFKVPTSQKRV